MLMPHQCKLCKDRLRLDLELAAHVTKAAQTLGLKAGEAEIDEHLAQYHIDGHQSETN